MLACFYLKTWKLFEVESVDFETATTEFCQSRIELGELQCTQIPFLYSSGSDGTYMRGLKDASQSL